MREEKVAISLAGPGGRAAPMDPRFGRAARFLLVGAPGSAELEIVNPGGEGAHGAGGAAAAILVEHGVAAVISGRFGPNALEALRSAGIRAFVAPEGLTAGQALDRYRAGGLAEA